MSTPYERVAVLNALAGKVQEALTAAKADVLALMDEGDRKAVRRGEDELAGITFTKGSVKVTVDSMGDLLEWCRDNVPDAIVTTRTLTPAAQMRAESAYLKTAAAHEVIVREVVEQSRLDEFVKDVKGGADIPGIGRRKGDGYLTVRQSPEQKETVARLHREGVVALELGD